MWRRREGEKLGYQHAITVLAMSGWHHAYRKNIKDHIKRAEVFGRPDICAGVLMMLLVHVDVKPSVGVQRPVDPVKYCFESWRERINLCESGGLPIAPR